MGTLEWRLGPLPLTVSDAWGKSVCMREVLHAGYSSPPHSGGSWRLLKLTMVGSPGGLTNVVQVFSTLDARLERLEYVQKAGDGLAVLTAWLTAEGRIIDLLHRKLTRLIEVLSVELPPAGAELSPTNSKEKETSE